MQGRSPKPLSKSGAHFRQAAGPLRRLWHKAHPRLADEIERARGLQTRTVLDASEASHGRAGERS
jgi:hypothetical protein